jgi:hypothetical protein
MSGDERSPRPLSVIESDIEVTKLGRGVCQAIVDSLLAQRYALLSAGWPTTHALCVDLDQDAARWAAHTEQMRRSLLDLLRERDSTPHLESDGQGVLS